MWTAPRNVFQRKCVASQIYLRKELLTVKPVVKKRARNQNLQEKVQLQCLYKKKNKNQITRSFNLLKYNVFVDDVPETFEQAKTSDFDSWKTGINGEIKSLNKSKILVLVEKRSDAKLIDSQ